MSEKTEYAKALSGLTDTMLDVIKQQDRMELAAEGGAWQTLQELRRSLSDAQREAWSLAQGVKDLTKGSGKTFQCAGDLLHRVADLSDLSTRLANLLGAPAVLDLFGRDGGFD